MNSKEFIKLCEENNINDIQIMITEEYNSVISFENENINQNQNIDVISYLINAKYLNNTITLSTEVLDDSIIDEIKELATYTEKIKELEFAPNIIVESNQEIKKNNVDAFKEKLLNIATDTLTKEKRIKKIMQEISFVSVSKNLVNSKCLDIKSTSSFYTYSVEIIANDGKENSSTWDAISVKEPSLLNIESIVNETLEKALMHLDEYDIKNDKYKILFAPSVVTNITSYLLNLLNGDNINKKISMLQGKLNERVFSPKLTITEDACNSNALQYRSFDDEGTKTFTNKLIVDGILKSFLYNNASAKDAKIKSTGNGYNDTIMHKNIIINSGEKNINDLLQSIEYGLYITDVMISSTARNIGTGIYSGNIIGYLIENGKIKYAIKNAIINTNLIEIYNNIIDISKEQKYIDSTIKAPYLLIDNLTVTGKKEENEN